MAPHVMTVRGPVSPDELGRVDAHEHLFLRTPQTPNDSFWDEAKTTEEAKLVHSSGIRTIVDLTTVGLGRRPTALAAVSATAGVHIVAATGYHRSAHYSPWHWAHTADHDLLVNVLLTDLNSGMDDRDWSGPWPAPSHVRAGIIKVGASYQHIAPDERRWFAAAAEAARRTGVSVAVHCEIGSAAQEILDYLGDLGVDSDRIMLAHTDRNPDLELHKQLATRGAYLVYDTIGRVKYGPDSRILDLICGMTDAGLVDHLCLGTDVGRRSMLRAYGGGPGMDVLGREFVPRVEKMLGREVVDTILCLAPAHVLTIGERAS
jgi:phosphotriesterase-related protein